MLAPIMQRIIVLGIEIIFRTMKRLFYRAKIGVDYVFEPQNFHTAFTASRG